MCISMTSMMDSRGTTPPEEIPEQLENDVDSSESSSLAKYPKAFMVQVAAINKVKIIW